MVSEWFPKSREHDSFGAVCKYVLHKQAYLRYKETITENVRKLVLKNSINQLTSVGPPEFLHSMPHEHDS